MFKRRASVMGSDSADSNHLGGLKLLKASETSGATPPTRLDVVLPPRHRRLLKRTVDVVLSVGMLTASLPVFGAIAIAIRLQDGGPVLYRQKRWGYLGHTFDVYKFRSMIVESKDLEAVRPASVDDDRVTGLGRLLRRSGLDELPQLVNILKGDMSFVGPRALAVGETIGDAEEDGKTYEEIPGFWQRLAVRPGLTGVATIYLPKDAPPMKKFEQDVAYVARQSLVLDLRLILLSFYISLRGKWESRAGKL